MSNLQNRSLFQAVLETAHQSLLSQSVRTYSLAVFGPVADVRFDRSCSSASAVKHA